MTKIRIMRSFEKQGLALASRTIRASQEYLRRVERITERLSTNQWEWVGENRVRRLPRKLNQPLN